MRTEDKKPDKIKNEDTINNTEKQQSKSKVTLFRYPYSESDDPEIDAFILRGLRKEADEAEAWVNSDPELSQINPPEDQYDQIVVRLKEMGIWEEDEEEEKLTEEERAKEVAAAQEEIEAANRARELGEMEEELAEALEENPEENLREGKTEENPGEGLREKELESNSADGAEYVQAGIYERVASGKEVLGEDELYQMLSEKDQEAIVLGWRAQEKKKKRSRYMRIFVKRGGIVAAAFVLRICVSMIVSASRRWIVQMWGAVAEVFATRTVTNSIEEEQVIQSTVAESLAAMEEIEEQTGIPGLNFSYWPEGMEYLWYDILDDNLEANVFYSYNESIVKVYLKNAGSDETSYYVSDENMELVNTMEILEGVEVKIWEENPGQTGDYYRAEFAYEEYRYIISGAFSMDEMEKIVKNINFLAQSL